MSLSSSWPPKRAVVFGLGKSGAAACRLLRRQGVWVVGLDERSSAEMGFEADALAKAGVELHLGGDAASWIGAVPADVVVVSPGVPLSRPELQNARRAGGLVIGEVELAFRFFGGGPLFGITGTNGKSTTTALLGELFHQAGKNVFVGGNLGRPLSESPLSGERCDFHVVELSSFQLEGIETLRLRGAALLNVTPDHLDRYPSHRDYGNAKARIFLNQQEGDFAVVNADDAFTVELAPKSVPVHGFSLQSPKNGRERFRCFAHANDGGFEMDWLGGVEHFILRNRALRGTHNAMNAMAAALLARGGGLSPEDIQRGLDSYPGLAHRLEHVRFLRGVEWVNDSKATNVDSTLMALRSFPKNVWLIAGGKGKGAPYEPLVAESLGRVKGMLSIGQDAPALERAFHNRIPVHPCGTLEAAVEQASQLATEGDVVLFSPACSSYDQFKNFEHRGECFKKWVRSLT